ncbi:hypothetical protein O6H91_06G133700 [Diphasiastrum complanatum]|uniref:Uncharacterized protein n=1 Tax=Diphasiastrum complanatum TaxID=34168 RepID=A0ACC2DJN8_DIPCM|nr:hypothetical protein O6H91_06G133700 [Diphasiastrum complanatum]
MGNRIACLRGWDQESDGRKSQSKAADKKMRALEEELIQQQLMAMAFQQQKKAHSRLERAASQRQPNSSNSFPEKVPRSASVRGRSLGDPLVDPHQLLNSLQDKEVLLNLETRHFVLVHGGGNGAWCWYKSIALLEEAGFKATAIDLTGSGIDSTDPNSIVSLSQYVKPLTGLLENIAENEKVILVGHNFGGACISYAMECFPQKIAKAVFVTATMVANGQRAYDVFSQEVVTSDDILKKAQMFIYGNGSSNPPTAIEFDRSLIKEVFFNQSPAKLFSGCCFGKCLDKACTLCTSFGKAYSYSRKLWKHTSIFC